MRIRRAYHILKQLFRHPCLVLMYHRIATPVTDPWQLAVSPENFEQHLQFLQRSKQVISLPQLVHKIRTRSLKKSHIAITFDDGYIDNCLVAKPLLEKYNLPATFFITSSNLGYNREFWWDELEKIILQTPEIPQQLLIEIADKPFLFNLGAEATLTQEIGMLHKNYIAFEPPTLRSQLYLKLWEILSPLNTQNQQKILEQLRAWAGLKPEARKDYCCMSSDQVFALASNNLFDIGGHTDSHPALAYHGKDFQQKEIIHNKNYLENLIGTRINLFAYPSGSFNNITVELLQESNFEAGFTTNYNYILAKDDPYRLNRLQINNWDKNTFNSVLSYCLKN